MLVQAARESGSPHFIYVSIVRTDRSPALYYRAKREAENLIAQAGLPWSVARATQFHGFGLRLIQSLGADALNVIPVPPDTRLQTIAADEVAERLVTLAEQGATHQRADFVAALIGEPGQPILTPVQLQVGANNPIDSSQGVCC